MEISISLDAGGYTVISDGTERGTMRYLYYSRRECMALYREKFGLKGKRLTITRG